VRVEHLHAMKYSEQLKDPRWIEKRDKIKQRDNFKCVICSSRDFIQVHHFYYIAKRMAWEYPDDSLLCLCEKYHNRETETARTKTTNWEQASCVLIRAVSSVHDKYQSQI